MTKQAAVGGDVLTLPIARGETVEDAPPVMVVRGGRSRLGGSTCLNWMVQRAANQGRQMIVADAAPNDTLASCHPGLATRPVSHDPADLKDWITAVLNRMAEEERSVAMDLGGGNPILAEYARDLSLPEFCADLGVRLLPIYFVAMRTRRRRWRAMWCWR